MRRHATGAAAAALLVMTTVWAAPSGAAPQACDGVTVDCEIGDTGPGGGIVFYDAGAEQGWGRYLEVAPAGWNRGRPDPRIHWCPWGAKGFNRPVATGTEIGTGAGNTRLVIEACGRATAAGTAAAYTARGKGDWFLPAKDELNALFQARREISGIPAVSYWTSSQSDAFVDYAYFQSFFSGNQSGWFFKGYERRVRPVRAF